MRVILSLGHTGGEKQSNLSSTPFRSTVLPTSLATYGKRYKMKMIWWEKTVEYFFVQRHVDLNMLICPLDGDHEKAGDALFANEDRWILIEFKKDKEGIASEQDKFNDFAKAKAHFIERDQHHFLIYGSIDEAENFVLQSQTYFSGNRRSTDSVLTSGIQQSQFITYLNEFIEFKKSSKVSSGGFSYVAGVSSSSGRITKCLKLNEYAQALQLQYQLEIDNEKKQDRSYSMDR